MRRLQLSQEQQVEWAELRGGDARKFCRYSPREEHRRPACRPARRGAKEESQGWKELEERSSEFKRRQVSGIGNSALGAQRKIHSSLDTIQEPSLRGRVQPKDPLSRDR